jgi:hypothetical protein
MSERERDEAKAQQAADTYQNAKQNWQAQIAVGALNGLNATTACRQDARTAIKEHAERLMRQARELLALLDAIPAKVSPEADAALWTLITSVRR